MRSTECLLVDVGLFDSMDVFAGAVHYRQCPFYDMIWLFALLRIASILCWCQFCVKWHLDVLNCDM